MNRFSSLFFFRAALLCAAFFSLLQNAAAQDPAARRLLDAAQRQMDSSNYETALVNARRAESLLLPALGGDSSDAQLAEAVCLAGMCLLKTPGRDQDVVPYIIRAQAMLPAAAPLDQAHIHLFTGNIWQAFVQQLPDSGLVEYRAAIALYQGLTPEGQLPHPNEARAHSGAGRMLTLKFETEAALAEFQIAEKQFLRRFGPMHPNIGHPFNNRGLLYWQTGQLDLALLDLQKAGDIWDATLPRGHFETGIANNNKGLIYDDKGSFEQAEQCFRKAIGIAKKSGHAQLLATALSNLGGVLNNQWKHGEALSLFREAALLEEKIGTNANENAKTWGNVGVAFRDLAAAENNPVLLDSALFYQKKALALADSNNDELHNRLGSVHEKRMEFGLAKAACRRALAVQKARHLNPATTFYNLTSIALAEGRLDSALIWNDSAALSLGYDLRDEANLKRVSSFFMLAQVLAQRNLLNWSSPAVRRDAAALLRLRNACVRTLEVWETAMLAARETADRFKLKTAAFLNYEIAISADVRLYELTRDQRHREDAFRLAEKSKAQVLLQAVHEANVLAYSGLPLTLLNQERAMQGQIASLETQRKLLIDNGISPEDPKAMRLSEQRDSLRLRHDAFVQQLASQSEAFRKARLGAPPVSLPWLRDTLLGPRQTLLEYFVGDSSIFLFVVKKARPLEVLEIKKGFSLERWADSLTRHGIYAWHDLPREERTDEAAAAANATYTRAALFLYDTLLRRAAGLLDSQLIIIPDGVLSLVPFEALLPQKPERENVFLHYRFLAESKQISYCYSAAMLREMRGRKRPVPPRPTVLAMAPFTGNRARAAAPVSPLNKGLGDPPVETFEALGPDSTEMKAIQRLFPKGTFLYERAATRAAFLREAVGFQIVHLSTHGRADDRSGDYSFLVFEKKPAPASGYSKVYARDLYALPLRADLVALSACETGKGQWQRGEGIIGLAWAVSIAGAKSLVTSLWKVDDKATAKIMADFYQNLKAGKHKDEALCAAKRAFLADHKNGGGELRHPYFWAGFVAVGDMRPLTAQ